MPPKTLMTPEEVLQSIRDTPRDYCLYTSHNVDVTLSCPCGTYQNGKFSWQHMVNHMLKLEEAKLDDGDD